MLATLAAHLIGHFIPGQYMALVVAICTVVIALDNAFSYMPWFQGNTTLQVIHKDLIPALVKLVQNTTTGAPSQGAAQVNADIRPPDGAKGPESDEVAK